MKEKSPGTKTPLSDADDAPELSEEFFAKAQWSIGNTPVSTKAGAAAMTKALQRGRPKSPSVKQSLTVRYDRDIIDAFKASGRGWQSRMNDALRDWLKTHQHLA